MTFSDSEDESASDNRRSSLNEFDSEEELAGPGTPLQKVGEEAASPVDSDLRRHFLSDNQMISLEQNLYLLLERNVARARELSLEHAYGDNLSALEASRAKVEKNGDPMWGVFDTPQDILAFVRGWWGYDEWILEWGQRDSVSISPFGWY